MKMIQDNLTEKQLGKGNLSQYAVFLPAISGFYATYIGKQRAGNYVDPARMPAGLQDMEMMNWLNSQKALFPYKWSLYSAGHANLDLNKPDPTEDMVRDREPGTLMLGDSGGFQIAKGRWEGDWKANSGCPKAQKKRTDVLKWLDGIADYGMTLDIPTWVIHDKAAGAKCQINTLPEAVDATKFNNEYFMANRRGKKNGGVKILNVLQGDNHASAETWYQTMKEYCDPVKYPDINFDGWAMGGQNMCSISLILRRIVSLKFDNLLQPGIHDWIHFLGTSKLEWAVLLTVLQRGIRKHINPLLTISFDCASPFLATANGQVYFENVYPHDGKWSYRMEPTADDKKYGTDTRKWSAGVVADGIHDLWEESPISDTLTMKDICIYKPGDLNKIKKEGKTSWDSFSYALLMGHNVYQHITAVQEANRKYDAGVIPAMLIDARFVDSITIDKLVDTVLSTATRKEAIDILEANDRYFDQIVGTRGFSGKKEKNARSQYNVLFEFE
jgi:hypothetical protein